MKRIAWIVAVLVVAGCSAAPAPDISVTHEKGKAQAVSAVAAAFMECGLVVTNTDKDVGIVTSDWTSASSLLGMTKIRYSATVTDSDIKVRAYFENLVSGTASQLSMREEDPVLLKVVELVGGEMVVAPVAVE